MPKFQSPGQKRKKIVRILSFIIFLVATYVGSIVAAHFKNTIYQWIDDHQQVTALVMDLSTEEDEYRNLKGRKRSTTIYMISYAFDIGQEKFENTIEVDHSLYSSLQQGDSLTVWYASSDPLLNDARANIESTIASNTTIGNMLSAAPYTAPASLFLYYLLSFIFVRESKKKLVPGFYNDQSWLDIDDKYIVYLNQDELVYFAFDKRVSSKVQQAYQEDKALDELISISKPKEINRIPLQQITELSSNHNSDIIYIEYEDKTHSIEFLNQAIKAHALEIIKLQIPKELNYQLDQKSRLGATIPAALTLLAIFLIGYFVNMLLIQLVLGFIGIAWVIPTIFSRLLDPTETKSWVKPQQEGV
jgi:hypothetical protein